MTQREVHDRAVAMTALAKTFREDVEFSPMDASRTEREYLAEVVNSCIEAGATTINLPDTVGYATPDEWRALIAWMYEQVPALRNVVLSVHCHNDLGLATANSLVSVLGGARQIETCVNGIGERAGNAALEEVAMATRLHPRGVRRHHAARSLAAVSHLAPRLPAHRHARAAQQGRGRRQRVRAPLRHPPGRHAQGPPDLRDHGTGSGRGRVDARARQAERASCAARPARAARLPARRRGVAARLRPLQGARRPQARRHRPRPRGDRRRRAPGRRGDVPARASPGQLRHQPARHRDGAHAPERRREPRSGLDRRRPGRRDLSRHRLAGAGRRPSSRSSPSRRSPRAWTPSAR